MFYASDAVCMVGVVLFDRHRSFLISCNVPINRSLRRWSKEGGTQLGYIPIDKEKSKEENEKHAEACILLIE